MNSRSICTLTALAFGLSAAWSRTIIATTTIQTAVDQAMPGDIVQTQGRAYHENVTVSKKGITIRGVAGAVLDGTGLVGTDGIRVLSTDGSTLQGFTLNGLTIRNFSRNGIFLKSVDGFQIVGGSFSNDALYGIFPVFCSNGTVSGNRVSGSNDSGIYIGQSNHVVISANSVTNCTVGFDIENATSIRLESNVGSANSIGAIASIAPGLMLTNTSDVTIRANSFQQNNRPNPSTDPSDLLAYLPSGVGILVIATSHVTVSTNFALGNNSAGVAVIRLPAAFASLDPRIDPLPHDALVTGNLVTGNGAHANYKLAPLPGADLLWDVTGTNVGFVHNIFHTCFPPGLH